jgi:predicted regulator of Ras-like GTPase activity (Roadblock/LC7/MglB family)
MPLRVGQIVYSSFPKVGFKAVASQQVPWEIQQTFLQQIVYQHWNAYNPPHPGYRAAYFYQVSLEQTLFGWLYNDGKDDLNRSHVPYFLCYYLKELLNPVKLDKILDCLDTGPLALIERQALPPVLDEIALPDSLLYQAARPGVAIAQEIYQQSSQQLQQQKLISLFVAVDGAERLPLPPPPLNLAGRDRPDRRSPSDRPLVLLNQATVQPASPAPDTLETVLEELIAKPIGIQGAILLSLEGLPLTAPIGIDEDTAMIIAGSMLYLARSAQDELSWQDVEQVTVRGKDGHLILAHCNRDVLLLIKAGKTITGLLEGEINRALKKLKAVLQALDEEPLKPQVLPPLTKEALPKPNEVIYELRSDSP